METEQQHPTSFRFTADELAKIDQLATQIYEGFGGTITISRKAALMTGVDLALRVNWAAAHGGVS